MNPEVSVILPNYNHAPYLEQRIESILNQSFQSFELIILDDCSTDHSLSIINSYSNNSKIASIIVNEENSGSPFRQWIKGIKVSKGNYIWIAESDDFSSTEFLKDVFQQAKSHNLSLAYCQSFDVDKNGMITNDRINWTNDCNTTLWKTNFICKSKDLLKYIYKKNIIPNVSACLFLKSDLLPLLEKNPVISDFKMSGDWLLYIKLLQKNVKIGFVDKHLNFFRSSAQSTRVHNNKAKKQNRILEEISIFSYIRKEMSETDYLEKKVILKSKWFHIHSIKELDISFFRAKKPLDTNAFSLMISYLKYKFKHLRH